MMLCLAVMAVVYISQEVMSGLVLVSRIEIASIKVTPVQIDLCIAKQFVRVLVGYSDDFLEQNLRVNTSFFILLENQTADRTKTLDPSGSTKTPAGQLFHPRSGQSVFPVGHWKCNG